MIKQPIPPDLRWEVWERDNFTCRHCGVRRHLSVDHIIAESKGGPMTLDNLQTLCRSCNSRKGAGPIVKNVKVKLGRKRSQRARRNSSAPTVFEWERCYLMFEVADQCGVSERTVRRWLQAGVPAINVGSATRPDWRFEKQEVRAWLDAGKPERKEKGGGA